MQGGCPEIDANSQKTFRVFRKQDQWDMEYAGHERAFFCKNAAYVQRVLMSINPCII